MKIICLILSVAILFLTSCSISPELTFYLVSQTPRPEAKKIGCDEYLVPVKKSVIGNVTVEKALQTLFNADPKKYGKDLMTATVFKDKYFSLESVEDRKFGSVDGVLVSLKRNENVSLTGVCDTPRIKEQLTETVRAAAFPKPFMIRLDGSTKEWECLGDESGKCK